MKFFNSLSLLTTLASTSFAVVVPGADTPLFYIVSTSKDAAPNLLPLRLQGGTGGFASLTGNSAVAQLYFVAGKLTALDPAGSAITFKPHISATLTSSGCTKYGPLGFVQGTSTNKCAQYGNFQIQSNTENSQLGARLVFNFEGGFYSCGATQDIWYKVDPLDGPTDCAALDLYTVPVA